MMASVRTFKAAFFNDKAWQARLAYVVFIATLLVYAVFAFAPPFSVAAAVILGILWAVTVIAFILFHRSAKQFDANAMHARMCFFAVACSVMQIGTAIISGGGSGVQHQWGITSLCTTSIFEVLSVGIMGSMTSSMRLIQARSAISTELPPSAFEQEETTIPGTNLPTIAATRSNGRI